MQNISVLLINDNAEKVSLIKEALSVAGITNFRFVKNYSNALFLLKGNTFNLVITELYLQNSGGNSLEFILKVRKDFENYAHIQDIPIIITASSVVKREVELARDSGVTEFVIYPFSISYFIKVVKSVFYVPRKFIVSKVFFGPDRRRKSEYRAGEERRKDRSGGTAADRKNPEPTPEKEQKD